MEEVGRRATNAGLDAEDGQGRLFERLVDGVSSWSHDATVVTSPRRLYLPPPHECLWRDAEEVIPNFFYRNPARRVSPMASHDQWKFWEDRAMRTLVAPLRLAAPALAQDLVSPGPVRSVAHDVSVEIHDRIAATSVTQVNQNLDSVQREGTDHVFAILAVFIVEFQMWINCRVMQGEMIDRQRAEQIYRSIVDRRKDPGILDHVRDNVLRVRVFPIPPQGGLVIPTRYVEVLPGVGGYYDTLPFSSPGQRPPSPSTSTCTPRRRPSRRSTPGASRSRRAQRSSTSEATGRRLRPGHHAARRGPARGAGPDPDGPPAIRSSQVITVTVW